MKASAKHWRTKKDEQESSQEYYERLHEAYFRPKNEELHFKSLFVQNLHSKTRHHLGVKACPETLTSRQLHKVATKGLTKQRQILDKSTETNTLGVSTKSPPLGLEGAPGVEPRKSTTPPH